MVLHELAVLVVVRAEGEELEPLVAGLELADDVRGHAQRGQRLEVDDVVTELDAAAAGEHDVDLLGLVVLVGEALAPARLDAVEAHAGVLGLEVAAAEAGLLVVAEPELG